MSSKLKLSPLALAVAALFASPLALADRDGNDGNYNRDPVSITYKNSTEVSLEQKSEISNDIRVSGNPRVQGTIPVGSESGAIVDTKQQSTNQEVGNSIVDNNAVVEGNAMQNATGNIGLNVTSGDNNQQTNDAALSAIDATFVFANASSYGYQNAKDNATVNVGTRNTARLSGNALSSAQGNIAVNVSAGDSNVQANALAASVNNSGTLAKASSYTNQVSSNNVTANLGQNYQIENVLGVSLQANLSGSYSGSGQGTYSGTESAVRGAAYQQANYYLDTWSGALPHPSGNATGHIDVDNEIQNATPNPFRDGVGGLAFDTYTPAHSEGGSLGFSEAGTQSLSGTVSGQVVYLQTVFRPHTNTAYLGDSALMNASGNIGVNIAAGTNNLQRNSLAIAAARGAGGGGGGGGGGE